MSHWDVVRILDILRVLQVLTYFIKTIIIFILKVTLMQIRLDLQMLGDLPLVIVSLLMVARSSAESEYRAMTNTTCELDWLKHLMEELGFKQQEPMTLICDNQAALHIASNPVFHEITKHIAGDRHLVRDKLMRNVIHTHSVRSMDQLANLFIKSLPGSRAKYICNKLGTYNIYAPA